MQYEKTITLTQEQHDRLQKYLVEPKNETEAIDPDDYFVLTVVFDNKYKMDIYIYPTAFEENGDNLPWTEGSLYNPDNELESNTDCYTPDNFIGEWVLYDSDGNGYTLNIKDCD